jgi:hypothetical protein
MKIPIITILLIFIILFTSCGRKQEEVKLHKNSDKDTVVNSSTGQQEISNPKENELTSAGENVEVFKTAEAKNHINENAIVKGYVADVAIREKVAYLNFDKKYPKNTFSAVIFDSKFAEVGDLNIYKNQNVEVKGTITIYKDKPQIIVSSKNQIRIVK